MTPLRQRSIDDLRLRNYARRTIDTYVCQVASFARHFGRSPELLGPDDVRNDQLHPLQRKVSWSTLPAAAYHATVPAGSMRRRAGWRAGPAAFCRCAS